MCEVVKCKRRREGVSAAIKIKSLRQIDGSGSVRICAIWSEEKKLNFEIGNWMKIMKAQYTENITWERSRNWKML